LHSIDTGNNGNNRGAVIWCRVVRDTWGTGTMTPGAAGSVEERTLILLDGLSITCLEELGHSIPKRIWPAQIRTRPGPRLLLVLRPSKKSLNKQNPQARVFAKRENGLLGLSRRCGRFTG